MLLNANYKCQFKALTQIVDSEDQKIDGIPISFNNFADGITRTSLKEDNKYKLFITIPEESFGIIMLYKKTVLGSSTIELKTDGKMEQMNCESPASNKSLSLETDGLYILKLDKDVTYIEVKACKSGTSNLFFSNLDIIPKKTPLNPQLGLTADNDYNNVISKIKKYDSSNKFYYNYITDSSMLINFNDDDATETLMTPDIWYDYNNVCNKWVISELYTGEENEDEFNKGIMIDKSSKL